MILQMPGSGIEDSVTTKKETAKLTKYQVDPAFAERFTALAVTHKFVGSPHIDTLNNVGPFYGLSLWVKSGLLLHLSVLLPHDWNFYIVLFLLALPVVSLVVVIESLSNARLC